MEKEKCMYNPLTNRMPVIQGPFISVDNVPLPLQR